MELTEEIKEQIDLKNYEELLRGWRFAPIGSIVFQGETGEYWSERMKLLKPVNHVAISKIVGWDDSGFF